MQDPLKYAHRLGGFAEVCVGAGILDSCFYEKMNFIEALLKKVFHEEVQV